MKICRLTDEEAHAFVGQKFGVYRVVGVERRIDATEYFPHSFLLECTVCGRPRKITGVSIPRYKRDNRCICASKSKNGMSSITERNLEIHLSLLELQRIFDNYVLNRRKKHGK